MVDKIKSILRIRQEESCQDTYHEIKEGVFFRGHNLWLLALAMFISCIGLNTNSTATIIGAMLISPLMGPIVGLGFGWGIGSRSMVQISLYNWVIMVLTSLSASSLYFLISPFDFATEQLVSFHEASIFDVLIAFFGGLAGFLGITRKEAVKVIAGVAVATACIPPLCTAGYGLATLQWDFFAGGLYFYLINCFFIGLGTWLLTLTLGYRKAFLEKDSQQKKTSFWLIISALVMIVPSILLASRKWERQSLKRKAEQQIQKLHTLYPDLVIIHYEIVPNKNQNALSVSVLNDSSSISSNIINESKKLTLDLPLVWHFAPNKANADIQLLQRQINFLNKKIKIQDSLLHALTERSTNSPTKP